MTECSVKKGNGTSGPENSNRGPFETRAAARQELKHYADTMEFIEDNELPPDIDRGDVTLVEMEEPNF